MSQKTVNVLLDYCAPIPVGHRVELTFFGIKPFKFLGDAPPELQPHHPWMRDLDTGVEYGSHWHYTDAVGLRIGAGNVYPLQRRQDLHVLNQIRGEVLACRVLTERANTQQIQTTLIIAPR